LWAVALAAARKQTDNIRKRSRGWQGRPPRDTFLECKPTTRGRNTMARRFPMTRTSTYKRFAAFTLVELLVVIAIIGVLVALLLPAVQSAREAARRTACLNKVKQLALALHQHHDSHKASPAGAQSINNLSWRPYILPYIEQQAVYDQ